MLGKLLKYELKSTARIFFPAFAAVLVLSICNKLSMTFLPDRGTPFEISQMLLLLLYIFMIIAALVLCLIITVQRFYKNLLGPEGYLMFTLPVKPALHILSKGITALLWLASTVLVIFASIFILMPEYDWIPDLFRELSQMGQVVYAETGLRLWIVCLLGGAVVIAGCCNLILEIYAAISIGQLSNSRKLLCAFAAYVGIDIVEQTINSILLAVLFLPSFRAIFDIPKGQLDQQMPGYVLAILVMALVTECAYAAGCFFGTRWLLEKKLNLE